MSITLARLSTIGHLDEVSSRGGKLKIRGWFVPQDRPDLTCAGVTIRLHGRGRVTSSFLLDSLDSPDVARAFPSLAGAERARFQGTIVVRQDPEVDRPLWRRLMPDTPHDLLLELIPRFVDDGAVHDGQSFFYLLNPGLPRPRPEQIESIGGGFFEVMQANLGHFVTRADLSPGEDVLDVGCGIGRMAYILAYYLAPGSRYEGFDVDRTMIEWAQKHIAGNRPNFHFRHVDIFNTHYHPQGKVSASEFVFPYPDSGFDFVCLTSVFTHLVPDDARRYLSEIHRVLRPGGRCAATAFLMDEETMRLIRDGKSSQPLCHPYEGSWIGYPSDPEASIGHPRADFLGWAQAIGFEIGGVYQGIWPGRTESMEHQDMIVLRKAG